MHSSTAIPFLLASLAGTLRAQGTTPAPAPVPVPMPAPAATPAPAAPDARLQELLRELRTTDAAAWAARLAELERQAKALDADAAKHRADAAGLQQRAEAAMAAAAARRSEVQKLQELQLLLASLPAVTKPAADAASTSTSPPTSSPPPKAKPAEAPPPTKQPPEAVPASAPASAAVAAPAMPTNKTDAAEPSAVVAWPQVASLFQATCTGCHEPGEQKGGLDLTTFRGAVTGGGSGQSIVPGDPEQSRLWRMVAQQERPFMPRNADPLTKDQLATVRSWIEHGAAETTDAARTFIAERAKKAKAAAAAAVDPAAVDANASASALPDEVPILAVRSPARPGPVTSLAASPAAKLWAMPGVQQVLLLGADLAVRAVLPCELPHIGPLAFAEDGSALLVTGGEPGKRGTAMLYEVRTGAVLATCGDERDVPLAAAVHRRSGLLAVGGAGKHARVYRLADGTLAMAGKHADFVLGLSFAPDGKWLAAGDRAGNVLVWETGSGRVFQTLAGHQGAVHAVAFDRTGKSLLTAGADGTLRLWDIAAAKERWRQTAHGNQQALACAFGPGDTIASCGSDGVIATFNTAGRAGAASAPVGDWLYTVAFGPSANDVFAGDWQGRVHRFDLAKKTVAVMQPLMPSR